jgi:hypothetical protein
LFVIALIALTFERTSRVIVGKNWNCFANDIAIVFALANKNSFLDHEEL